MVVWVRLMICRTCPSLHAGADEQQAELWVRLPPDLCMDTAAISAPASMADTGMFVAEVEVGAVGLVRQAAACPCSWAISTMARRSEQMP